MALNQKMLAKVLTKEIKKIPARADDYHNDLESIVSSILQHEHQHRVHGTFIQQKVNDIFDQVAKKQLDKIDTDN